MEGIDYRPDGTILIGFDGQTWRLERPTLGVYKQFTGRLAEMRQAIQQVNSQIVQLRNQLDDNNTSEVQQKIEDLNVPIWEYSLPILADLVATVSDRPLPENQDSWPAWLATNFAIPSRIVEHWNEVPKVPGGAATS